MVAFTACVFFKLLIWKHCLSSQLFLNVTVVMIQYCFYPVELLAGSLLLHAAVYVKDDVKEVGLLMRE